MLHSFIDLLPRSAALQLLADLGCLAVFRPRGDRVKFVFRGITDGPVVSSRRFLKGLTVASHEALRDLIMMLSEL